MRIEAGWLDREKAGAGRCLRLPGLRPPNEVWSMDFVFDRTAEGRVIKCLTVIDNVTHEVVVIEEWREISPVQV